MAYPLTTKLKTMLMVSSLVTVMVLGMATRREKFAAQWIGYQKQYKAALGSLAASDEEKRTAATFEIKMRQIVLPELDARMDRCVICHVGMEDPQAAEMDHPLRTHPGEFLAIHDVDKFGCTVCHGGQGRAITSAKAKARADHFFWEDPVLPAPFAHARCVSCHDADELEPDSLAARGRDVFRQSGCLGCHILNGLGPGSGNDLSRLGTESFHIKYPVGPNKHAYLDTFEHNKNIAYVYESIADPDAEGLGSQMTKYDLPEEDLLALTVYLVGATGPVVPRSFRSVMSLMKELEKEPFTGEALYTMYCQACHGERGRGEVANINARDKVMPELLYARDGFSREELFDLMRQGVETKKKDPQGPTPISMPAWAGALDEREMNALVDYLFAVYPEDEE